MERKPVICCQDVSFQYDAQKQPTLHDINVTIYEGEKILILGPSGSGKSTFANMINGLCPHAFPGKITGKMEVMGKDVTKESVFSLSTKVGTVLQDTDGQFIGLSVAEDIAFAMENDCVPNDEMYRRVDRWADRVFVKPLLHHRPQALSGGQKQRVSMAGVLIDEVPILLFDEPLANLDPATGKEAIALIDDLQKQENTTVLIIEHRLEDVLYRDVDRILLFENGRISADMAPDELLLSGKLPEAGIREPLYLNAMRYAGVNLKELKNPARLDKVDGADVKEKLNSWQKTHPVQKKETAGKELLCIQDVSFSYNDEDEPVLKGISLKINEGEMISIVGQNGAGKSTLSKAICGFLKPKQGKMTWEGEDMAGLSIKERADRIGYVMQNPNQMISKAMIFDEVALGLRLRSIAEDKIKDKVYETLKICGLYPFRNWPVSALSFGQKKRVSIASILVLSPKLLLLDEPTAGQDFRNYTRMMDFLQSLNERGITVVMITHDMHLMLEYTNRAIVMTKGKILADTDPVRVLTNPELVKQADLKETSLFTVARRFDLPDAYSFAKCFIEYDRKERSHGAV